MPGICGIIERSKAAELPSILAAMQRDLTYNSWHVSRGRADVECGAALGSVRLDFTPSNERFFWDEASGSGIVVHGEVYNTWLPGSRDEGNGPAAALLAGFLRRGEDFLCRLNGSYSAAIWNGERQQITLISDRFGSRPVYYRRTPGSLRFASGLAALLAGDNLPRRVSPRGLAQFFTFGHYLRHDTALEDVHVLPAATCLTFDVEQQ